MSPKENQDKQSSFIKEMTWKRKKVRYKVNRIIIKLKQPAEDTTMTLDEFSKTICKQIPKGKIVRQPRATGRVIYSVDPTANIGALARKLSRRKEVEYAEPDIVDHEAIIPDDPRYTDQWALDMISAENAWDLETGSTNVLIGIIDSGISMSANLSGGFVLDHPDLNDTSRYILGTDYVDGGEPRDLRGHGTHVTGIAAAETNNNTGIAGVNWNSLVYICRTLDANGDGSSSDFADAVEEIVDYAVDNNMKAIINYSAGGGDNQTKKDACQYADDNGMIICAATGNDNGGPVIFPAAYSTQFDAVIAVGSTDDDDSVSNFSNVGPEVTVVAPGRDILSTTPTYAVTIAASLNYAEYNGTSMATPHVTGLAALILSISPDLTSRRVRKIIETTADDLGPAGRDDDSGHGRINCERALSLIYIVNRNTREIHKSHCGWVNLMNESNKMSCDNLDEVMELIRDRRYNGCFYCLSRYDRDTLSQQRVLANLAEDLAG